MKQSLAIFLLFAVILQFAACGTSNQKNEISDRDLTVEEAEIAYSGLQIGSFTKRIRSAVCRTVFLIDKTEFNDDQLNELDSYIKNTVLPILQEEAVTGDQLNELIFFADTLLSTAEKSGKLMAYRMWEESYRNCIGVLGSEKTGKVFYRSTLLYLDYKLKVATEHYDQYGDEITLQQIEKLQEKKTSLESVLGQEAFATAAVFSFFTGSILSDTNKDGKDGFTLSDAELRLLWIRQADYFINRPLSEAQWSTAADIFSFLGLTSLSPSDLTDWQKEMWNIHTADQGIFTNTAQTIPAFLSLYQAFAAEVTAKEVGILRTSEPDAVCQTLCSVLSRCETELMDFLDIFSEKAQSNSEAEKAVLQKSGLWEDYLTYCEKHTPLSAKELVHTLSLYRDTQELKTDIENYLFGIMPYITFSIFHERSDAV